MSDTDKARPSNAAALLEAIEALGLPVPPVLIGEARPLSLSTRQDLQPWCELHGYDAATTQLLNSIIGRHVRSTSYLTALAADLSERFDLDGAEAGRVSEFDRHGAAMLLHSRAMGNARGPTEKREPRAEPSPASAPEKRPTIRLGALEGRRAAFAGTGK